MTQHILYEPKDFAQLQVDQSIVLARLVLDGGLSICKLCGAGEVELDDYPTCEEYGNRDD